MATDPGAKVLFGRRLWVLPYGCSWAQLYVAQRLNKQRQLTVAHQGIEVQPPKRSASTPPQTKTRTSDYSQLPLQQHLPQTAALVILLRVYSHRRRASFSSIDPLFGVLGFLSYSSPCLGSAHTNTFQSLACVFRVNDSPAKPACEARAFPPLPQQPPSRRGY